MLFVIYCCLLGFCGLVSGGWWLVFGGVGVWGLMFTCKRDLSCGRRRVRVKGPSSYADAMTSAHEGLAVVVTLLLLLLLLLLSSITLIHISAATRVAAVKSHSPTTSPESDNTMLQ